MRQIRLVLGRSFNVRTCVKLVMNIGNLRRLTALVLLLVSLGCVAQGKTNAKSVLAEVNAALSKGDAPDVIESYFKNRGLFASYDRFGSRYQSIIRNTGGPLDHAVVIYVYVDEKRRLLRVETHDSYTGP